MLSAGSWSPPRRDCPEARNDAGSLFLPLSEAAAAGMAGIQGARKLLFFRDSNVDQDPSHQGDCLLHAAAVSFSHLLVDPLAADAAGFFIGQFDRFAKQNWNRRTQRYRHTMVRVRRVTTGTVPCVPIEHLLKCCIINGYDEYSVSKIRRHSGKKAGP